MAVFYKTSEAESLAGIAIRELHDESLWTEIRDLNAKRFPDMCSSDYFPVESIIELPSVIHPT